MTMIEVHNATPKQSLSPKLAIVIYGTDRLYRGEDNTAYATVHQVRTSNGPPKLQAGVPVNREALSRILLQLSHTAGVQMLPPNVLAVGPDYVVWWSAPQRRGAWFAAESRLGSRQAVVPHPGLVFVAVGEEVYVIAVKGESRPTSDAPALMPPYFNVWKPGRVCKGNAPFPKRPAVQEIETYTRAFFDSYSTAPNVQTGLVRYRGGPTALWRDLLDGKHERFPEHTLVSLGTTVGEYLSAVIGGRYARAG